MKIIGLKNWLIIKAIPQNVHFSGKASTDLLTSLADVEATEAVEELLPRVSQWPGLSQACVSERDFWFNQEWDDYP